MEEEGEEEEGERPDPILHYLRNYFISHTDRETLMESATVITEYLMPVLGIRIRRIRVFLGLQDPYPSVKRFGSGSFPFLK
jgi:hypothetical protein